VKRAALTLLLLGILVARPVASQIVVKPDPPLDSARAALRDALLVLRDSLNSIDGAAARLQRDYRNASGPALLSRAQVMRDACARSERTIPATRKTVEDTRITEPLRLKQRKGLISEMERLKTALAKCETEFAAMSQPDQAERVRGYGNDRAGRIQESLRRYEASFRDFLSAMSIKVMPLGATSRPGR
jgi:hypothetical protein